jgi:hypothetical protein
MTLQAPFPYFGGKRKIAAEVWSRFGDVKNYVEPFFGSGAVLLARPQPFSGNETINDIDGMVANFWRSIKTQPSETAEWADQPVIENDLIARHIWLVNRKENLCEQLEGDPDYCDPKIAGWWVWGLSSWIGSGWCSGNGPWQSVDGKLVNTSNNGRGVNRKRPHLGNNGRGVNRKRPHLGNNGQGVNRKLPHLCNNGQGDRLGPWFRALADRLARVRVCSGDWSRVCGPSVTFKHGLTGVFLDPPYADTADRCDGLYANDSLIVAHDVRDWAVANGGNPLLRVALCGYAGEHEMPSEWAVHSWDAGKGYASYADDGSHNSQREVVWFSPHCLSTRQRGLFG